MYQKIKISALDKKFSFYIRSRDEWKCQRCFKQYVHPTSGLHCSHFYGRARKSTRFDEKNCMSICHGCHSHLTANPELHRQFMLKKIGQKEYDALMIRANFPRKPDYEMINLYLTEKLKELKNVAKI